MNPTDIIVNRLGVEVANHALTAARLTEAQARIEALEAQISALTPPEVTT